MKVKIKKTNIKKPIIKKKEKKSIKPTKTKQKKLLKKTSKIIKKLPIKKKKKLNDPKNFELSNNYNQKIEDLNLA